MTENPREDIINALNDLLELKLMILAIQSMPVWDDYWEKRRREDPETMEGLERLKALRGDHDE